MKVATKFEELPPEKLRWTLNPEKIPFRSTDECEPCEGIIGQERALKAIQTGLDIESLGYNIFITGMVGTGRTTTITKLLEKLEKEKEKIPDDILYVNNFKSPDEPTLITLPAGKGKLLKESMDHLIEILKTNIPALLKSKYYTDRRDSIIESQQKIQKKILKNFEEEVAKEGFSVIQVQMGPFSRPDLIPLIKGKPTPFNKIEALVREEKIPKAILEALKKKYEKLTGKLEEIFKQTKEIEENTRQLLKEWDANSITPIIKGAVSEIRAKFSLPKISEYLDNVEQNIVKNINFFKAQKKESEKSPPDPFLNYRVNLLVNNAELKGPPVVTETNPNYVNLFGAIESTPSRLGVWDTNFTKIKAGSFLKANGGFLVINALDALTEPGVWPTLKRTLRNQIFEIQNYTPLYLISAARLKPEPIKSNVKVVMIGDAYVYNLLYFLDKDFKKIFKIKAEFDSEMDKNQNTIKDYADFIKKICVDDKLKPFDKEGIAVIIEYATRLAGRKKKVTTRFHIIADVIREASYWATKEKKKQVSREQVEKAIEERSRRVSLVEDKIQELIEEGTLMIDTKGKFVGQVNGLSVYDMGEFAFGKPTRITAKTAVGRAGVINIEREADLSGRTHNKGVLILGGYLRGNYAQNKPFSLSASIAFEQSYSGVDGDSASSTEVYAILSSLSNLPLRQDIAVTGSLNQKGEIQPIGGVNEKIEGFFDVCKAGGLTGTQGVIMPHQNVQNLMVRKDVIEAVEQGKFHIYPVKTIDAGIEILTGIKAGKKKEDGTFEEGTVNYLVDQELQRLAQSWKEFSTPAEKE